MTGPTRLVSSSLADATAVPGRTCGGCTACCYMVPVEELKKPRFHHCKFEMKKQGCSIYAARPSACRIWNCAWLVSDAMPDSMRPDRAHVVINPVVEPDPMRLTDKLTGDVIEFQTITVWVDPSDPDAYRRVRRALYHYGDAGFALCIRIGMEAVAVFTGAAAERIGQPRDSWVEMKGASVRDGNWTDATLWEKEALGL